VPNALPPPDAAMAKFKPFSELDCSAAAEKLVPSVLRAQLKAMCKLRRQALDWKDPEGVHAMRVGSRRLRSAMSDFRPYVRVRLPRVKLRSVADALGAVRDQDVALLALNEFSEQAKGEAADGIQSIADEFQKKRKEARAKLKLAIRPAVIDEFREQFQEGLKELVIVSPKRSSSRSDAPVVTFRDVGRQIIVERIKEVRDASYHLYFPFHIKELHELRILAKRLRYAIEIFSGCWEPNLHAVAKEVSLLQTSLGELHDCDIWLEGLSARLKHLERKRYPDEQDRRIRAAAVWLTRHFAAERMEHYRAALGRWQEWTTNEFLTSLESVVKQDRKAS
jgi:CHAD domain-containing protein